MEEEREEKETKREGWREKMRGREKEGNNLLRIIFNSDQDRVAWEYMGSGTFLRAPNLVP